MAFALRFPTLVGLRGLLGVAKSVLASAAKPLSSDSFIAEIRVTLARFYHWLMCGDTAMSDDPFEGCWAKIERAKFHLKQFKGHLGAFERNLYGLIATKDDPQTGERVIQAVLPRALFVALSVVAGDVIHQARSSLDHLVYGLIIAKEAKPRGRASGFPIFWDADKYKKNGRPMLNGLSAAAIAIIDGLQPIKPDYATDPLYVLNELWNRDKHRLLSITSIRLNAFKEGYRDAERTFYLESPIFQPVAGSKDGAELDRFRPPLKLTPEVEVIQQADISGPLFEDAGPATGHEVLELLPRLIQTVEGITNDLVGTVVR